MGNGRSTVQLAEELLTLEAQRDQGTLDDACARRRQDLLRQLVDELRRRPIKTERRRFLRIPAPLQVRFRAGEATLTARAEELGLGGLSLRDHLWVIAGQQLRLEAVRVGDREFPLPVRCRVVWRIPDHASSPCAGLEFVELDQHGRRQIRRIFEDLFVTYLRASLPELSALDDVAPPPQGTAASPGADPAPQDAPSVPAPAPTADDQPVAPARASGWLDHVRSGGKGPDDE